MYKDTLNTGKNLQPADVIAQSLINLRDEMWANKDRYPVELFFKVNSCLYRGYPYISVVQRREQQFPKL